MWVLAGSLSILLALFLAAPRIVSGPRFARLVERNLPATRGQLTVGGGSWSWPALWSLWRGTAATFAFTEVRMVDPEGTEVFRAERVMGTLEWQRAPIRVTVHGLRVEHAAWRFARMRASSQIGFLAALMPARSPAVARASSDGGNHAAPSRPPAAPSTPSPPGGGPVFRIADARLEGLQATFAFPDWELTLQDVHAGGSLTYDGSRAAKPAFVFEVAGGDVRGGGHFGIVGAPAPLVVPFERAWLNRIATTAAQPDAILLDAAPVKVAGATATFSGRFTGVYGNGGPQPPPGIDAQIRVQQAPPAVREVLASWLPASALRSLSLTGDQASLSLELAGPFSGLTMTGAAQGFDIAYRGFQLRGVGFRAAGSASTRRAHLDGLTASSPGGGTMAVNGTLDRSRATATLTFEKFLLADCLPPAARPLAAGTLDGMLAGEFDAAQMAARLDGLALALTRPVGAAGPPVIRLNAPSRRRFKRQQGRQRTPDSGATAGGATAGGTTGGALTPAAVSTAKQTIVLPPISATLWGGTLTAAGTLLLVGQAPALDLRVAGHNISVDRVLGSTLVAGALSFRARVQGTPLLLVARVRFLPGATVRLFGERFALPGVFALRLGPDGLTIPLLRLAGARGGELNLVGRVSDGGLDLSVDVRRFPFAALPGLADADLPLTGMLAGHVRVTGGGGSPTPLSVAGALALAEVKFQGRSLGGGSLLLSPGSGGAFRARGQMVDGILIDGVLTPTARGLSGEARLELRQVRLDPFLDELPGGIRAAGVITGTATLRVGPDLPPTVDARLSALTLTLATSRGNPHAPARPAPPPGTNAVTSPAGAVELHAEQDVVMFAQPGRATYRLDTARFRGTAGSIELGGELRRGEMRGTVRGRLDLAALSPVLADLAPPSWDQRLSALSGTLDLDLHGVAKPDSTAPLITGSVIVTGQANLQEAGVRWNLRTTAARVDLDRRGATVNLPLTTTVQPAAARDRKTAAPTGHANQSSDISQSRASTLHITGGWGWVTAKPRDARLALDVAARLDASALTHLAPAYVQYATGLATMNARVRGTVSAPTLIAHLNLGGLSFTRPGAAAEPVRIVSGQVDADEQSAVMRDVQVQLGQRTRLTIGGRGQPATVRFQRYQPRAITAVDIPVQAEGVSFAARTAVIDDARFSLRLRGQPLRSLQLVGDVEVVKARVSSRPTKALKAGGATKTPPWVTGPEIQQMQLDLRLHSQGAAVTVDVPYVPDVRVDVDYQVRGTPQRLQLAGDVRSTGVYSAAALALYRLFK